MEMFIKTTMQPFFYWFSQPRLLREAFPLLHMLWQSSCACGACVCDAHVALSVVRQRKVSQIMSGLTPAILNFTGQEEEIAIRPHHTLRTSANTSKLARRTYALHPQVRTKLAIQKNKHNQNKQAVWTSLKMPSALSACDVEYENKMWYWKREHTKSVKSGLTRVNRTRPWKPA